MAGETHNQNGFDARFQAFDQRLIKLEEAIRRFIQQQQNLNGAEANRDGVQNQVAARNLKWEIPAFDGSDAEFWVFKINQFFTADKVPFDQRVVLASAYMTGPAYVWYKWMCPNQQLPSWDEFLESLLFRFGAIYDIPRVALKKEEQVNTVAEYRTESTSVPVTLAIIEDEQANEIISSVTLEMKSTIQADAAFCGVEEFAEDEVIVSIEASVIDNTVSVEFPELVIEESKLPTLDLVVEKQIFWSTPIEDSSDTCEAEQPGERAAMLCYRFLKRTIPLSYTVAVSFLACHVAREAVLPTDIMKWTLEGRLPYFTAFLEIEKRMRKLPSDCPLISMSMFKPSHAVPLQKLLISMSMFKPSHAVPPQKLEALAASIAESIGLELPPVNFYAVAYGYLQKLSLPVEKILPHACRIYEWSMPPDLWLSTSKLRLPTRVCVMTILIVSIRILYNLNGFGEWEKSLSQDDGASVEKENDDGMDTDFPSYDKGRHSEEVPLKPQEPEWDAARLLRHLYETCNEVAEKYEYSKDLSTYLKQCKDCFFAGLKPSFENHEEEYKMELLMNFYEKRKDSKPAEQVEQYCNSSNQKRPDNCLNQNRLRVITSTPKNKKRKECFSQLSPDNDDDDDASCDPSDVLGSMDIDSSSDFEEESECSVLEEESLDNEGIRRLKLDMEENKFCYIPPRKNVKRLDYLHYLRKVDEGAYTYVAHADYYILLRACAKAAQVDIRIMHIGVLSLERRLAWLEKRIDKCLHVKPPRISCQFCIAK